MNTQITETQKKYYQENGFVVQENFLSPEELAEWRAAIEEASEARQGRRFSNKETFGHDPKATADKQAGHNKPAKEFSAFHQLVNLWREYPRVQKFIVDERIGKMAATLEGLDGIRIWHDQSLIKRPWDGFTAYHRDNPYWSFHHPKAISVWVALDDATYENGCLYMIPGSQRDNTFRNSNIGKSLGSIFETMPEYAGVKPVAVPMKAGSCSFHNGLTIHGAGANMTPFPRRAMTIQFMPPGQVFNGNINILTEEEFAALKVGDRLDDDIRNPMLWSSGKNAEGREPYREKVAG